MCGRISLAKPGRDIARLFDLPDGLEIPFRYNIAPTQPLAALRVDGAGKRELASFRWGLVPWWSKEPKGFFNARADTVATKPAFKSPFRTRRCLVPADGFYEWKPTDGRKQPFHFRLKDGEPFAFAGLWDVWHNPADGEVVESCAIITTDANDVLQPVHHRMPVILDQKDYAVWLDSGAEPGQLTELLKPFRGDAMEGYPVSSYVNNSRNEGARCIEPAA